MSDHAQQDRALPVALPRDLTAEELERAIEERVGREHHPRAPVLLHR